MATTYLQGQRIALRGAVTVNAAPWDKWTAYSTNQYVTNGSKIWKALQASTGQTPATGGGYWVEDSGRVDADGVYFRLRVTRAGVVLFDATYSLTSPGTILTRLGVGLYQVLVATQDLWGNYEGWFWTDGNAEAPAEWRATVTQARPALVPPTVYGLIDEGQSLTIGTGGAPPLTATPPAGTHNLMLSCGIVAITGNAASAAAAAVTGVLPLVESGVETGLAEYANRLSALTGMRFIVASAGIGGTSYTNRVKGQPMYTALMAIADNMKAMVEAAGYVFGGWVMVRSLGGQADPYSVVDFLDYQGDLSGDLVAKSGQAFPVQMLFLPPDNATGGTFDICRQQLDAARNYPDRFALAGPMFWSQAADSNGHRVNLAYRQLGAMSARAAQQQSPVLGGTGWRGFQPLLVTRVANVVRVTCHVPTLPIVRDEAMATSPSGTVAGWEWAQASGTPPAITSVSVDGSDFVFVLATTPSGTGFQLRYAHTADVALSGGFAPPRTNGRRGPWRDSSTDVDSGGRLVPVALPSLNLDVT